MSIVFLYPELNDLVAKYHKIRTFNFFVYGNPSEEDITTINKGLYFRIIHATEIIKDRVVVIIETINEEKANLLNCYQGTRVIFGIAQNDIDEEIIETTVMDGLNYLRYKSEYMGMKETESNV